MTEGRAKRTRYYHIPVSKYAIIDKLRRIFPELNYTDKLDKILSYFSDVGAFKDRAAIWIDRDTYERLNRKGTTAEDFDVVIRRLLDYHDKGF